MRRPCRLTLLAAGLAFAPAIAAAAPPATAQFAGATAAAEVRRVADWAIAAGDNHGLPFLIVDKTGAEVVAFDGRGTLRGATPALLGLAHGDVSPPGIGSRKLSTITPSERVTPAGRFVAGLGHDLGAKDVLWVDYDAAISLHRVFTGTASEHRLERLATPSKLDNRISYGCINVPVAFYERIVQPLFTGTNGIVYILPETRPVESVFAIPRGARLADAKR